VLSAADVASARAVIDPTTAAWLVSVAFDVSGTARWESALAADPGRRIAILVNGTVVVAPKINPGNTEPTLAIAGSYTEASAKHVAAQLSP
jgi:preprotein translocase subunit SecD